MTIDQLRYFYETAKFQHVGKASKSLNISPSAISSAIVTLESEFDAKLFDRIGKNIVLTDAGKRLQKEAQNLLEQVQDLKAIVTGNFHVLSGHYRLGASHFLAPRTLTKAWSELQEGNEKLTGEICSLPSVQIIRGVISGELDFGLCFSPFQHPDLEMEVIYQGELQIIVKNTHPLSKMKFSVRSDCRILSEYPAVIYKSSPGVDVCENHPIFRALGVDVKPTLLYDDDTCAIEKVLHSAAWGFVPDFVVNRYAKRVKVLNLPSGKSAPYTITTLVRRDRAKSESFHRFKHVLTERIRTFL